MNRSHSRACRFDMLHYLMLLSFSLGLGLGWLFGQYTDNLAHTRHENSVQNPVLDIINLHRQYDHSLDLLEWSENLVYAASKLAHAKIDAQYSSQATPSGFAVGFWVTNTTENGTDFSTVRAISSIVNGWHADLVKVDTIGGVNKSVVEEVGPYTQLMSPGATKVGCVWSMIESSNTTVTWTLHCAFNSIAFHVIDAQTAVILGIEVPCLDCAPGLQLSKRGDKAIADMRQATWSGNPFPGGPNWYFFVNAIQGYLNHYRAKVGAAPLQWYDPLNDRAVSRANTCQGMYYLADDTSQSLYIIGNVNNTSIDFAEQTTTGIDYWWSRGFLLNDTAADNYDTQNMLDSFDYIHMVWKSTQYMSCAWSEHPCPNLESETTKDAFVLWCEFWPPGGEELYYHGNVTRPDTTGP